MSKLTGTILELVGPYHDPKSAQGRDFDALWAWLNLQPWRASELELALAEFGETVKLPKGKELKQAYADVFLDWFLLDRPLS